MANYFMYIIFLYFIPCKFLYLVTCDMIYNKNGIEHSTRQTDAADMIQKLNQLLKFA